ncbi:protein regulator of cytokinesis 1-like [Athalia rosae]|uniref:protein regulator of cytokinesis 1-like n=1 Tax=Athalia rosae TaxID=37344 RepID=UPI002033EB38|nr:protein regulator of cytokinesis 1-like [Athalia rosae]
MADSQCWLPVAEKINESVKEFMSEVYKIWDQMGLSPESKASRFEQVAIHVQDLIREMKTEAQDSRNELLQEVQELMKEAADLAEILNAEKLKIGNEEMPYLEAKATILNHLQKLRLLKQQRLSFAEELLDKEYKLCKVLGKQPFGFKDEIPSEVELKNFKLYLDIQEAEKTRLHLTFKESQRIIIEMMDELRLQPLTDFENLVYNNGENFILNNANMTRLRELHDHLKQQILDSQQEAEEKKKQLQDLWIYLEESSEKCQRFLETYTGYNVNTLKAFDEEIKRCKQKRSENIAKYVKKIRCRIEALWDQCQLGAEERRAFQLMQHQTFTEDLLTLHEMEADKLQKYYDENKAIFQLLEERDLLWQKMSSLDERATDPNRFHNRGGQLLAEEKERKVIQKKLPKIEEQLQDMLEAYAMKNGKTFMTHGVPLAEALKRSWTEYAAAKQSMVMARKQARDRSITGKRTPLSVSKRTPSAMSIRRPSPGNSIQRNQQTELTPFNRSRKRRNGSSESNRPTVSGSKIKRGNGRLPRRIITQSSKNRSSDQDNEANEQAPASSSTSVTSYGEFQEHLENRDELRSSVLPQQGIKSQSHKVRTTANRIKTPMKPLRKNLSAANTPRRASPNKLAQTPRASSRSPRAVPGSRLVPVTPGTLPVIF